MQKKPLTRKQRLIRRRNRMLAAIAIVLAVIIGLLIWGISALVGAFSSGTKTGEKETSSYVSSEPPAPTVVSTATVINVGDILIHGPVINGAKNGDGSYDFSPVFKYTNSFFTNADLAVANLEVTLGGTESGNYRGYPTFNCPDSIVDAAKNGGVGLLLTANNHCYDTGLYGIKRTVQTVRAKGLPSIGTRDSEDIKTYTVKEVDGVNIGMACYTYENSCATAGRKSINGMIVAEEGNNLISSFSYDRIDDFYAEAESVIADMKSGGADAIVFYMHWGEEYHLKENTWQDKIAQKLCDLGVDIIVGGHPHVLEPLDYLTSSDGTHTCVCAYSLGNFVSNQRQGLISAISTAHTEDGAMFSFTFDKYSDGKTVLSAVDVIPTWVNRYQKGNGTNLYTVVPLNNKTDGSALYGLSGTASTSCQNSYERTKSVLGKGLTKCQLALGCKVRFDDLIPAVSGEPAPSSSSDLASDVQ